MSSSGDSIVEYSYRRRSKEYAEHVEHADKGSFVSSAATEHYTKYPNYWSRIRYVTFHEGILSYG